MRRPPAIVATLLLGAGCSSLGPAPGAALPTATAYESGWASQAYQTGEADTLQALAGAMSDLKMRPEHRSRAAPETVAVDGTVHDGRHVRITVRSIPSGSFVAVRIGRFGDRAMAESLLERTGMRLGVRPVSATPDEPPTSGSTISRLLSRDAVSNSTMLQDRADAGYRDSLAP